MSTHVMALVEQLCDRVAVMAHGTIVRAGTLAQVAGQAGLEQAFPDAVGSGPVERELSWFAS
jgi:ABC-2 type transport system ATP-binding protein